MDFLEKIFFLFLGIPQVVKGVTVHQMLEIKTCDSQVSNRSHVLCEKGPRFVLSGAVFIQKAFQKIRLLNQIGIAFAVGIAPFIRKFGKRIERFEKLRSCFFHQGKKLLFRNDLDERFRFQGWIP